MKKYLAVALGLCSVVALTSCKSQESAYKKAYEKAKQQQVAVQQQPQTQTTVAVQPTQPATTVKTTPSVSTADANVRSESVQLIDGAGLKTYSVVCGSFSLKANAQGLQQKLKDAGYEAQIVLNPSNKFYRVVATTYDDLSSAVSSRNKLRGTYPDAWLLRK
jgi:cell division septation protein DedD